MNKSSSTISIITPSYQQVEFLETTIQSVLKQNYPCVEYIIMDGGSTDGSAEIIQRYSDHLAYWVSEPDNGQADAINRGFAQSHGEILGWINSDDTYEPEAFNKIVSIFSSHPEVDFIYGEGWYINYNGERMRPCKFVRDNFSLSYMVNKDPILQQAAFWRRSLWEKIGPLDETYHWVFDWEWFIRAYRQTNFYYLPEFLGNYRVHPQAKTRSSDIRRRIEHARITRTYGRWWHPNYLTQQARILEYYLCQSFQIFPQIIANPLSLLASLPRRMTEMIFYGRYVS